VRARVFDSAQAGTNNDWSAEVDATFLLETPFPLRITELHYNPAPLGGVSMEQDLEFIELTNTDASPISLDGVQITQFSNPGYTFPAGILLDGGQSIVVARSPAIFAQHYGAGIHVATTGYFDKNLSNGGERITLLGPLGEVLQDFTYDDAGGWPTSPDGAGKSLEIIDPLGDAGNPANWRESYYVGGSPGTSGEEPAIAGDFTRDGHVNGRDFLAWQRGFGTPALRGSADQGDADGDRDVDGDDLLLWSANFGMSAIVSNFATVMPLASADQTPQVVLPVEEVSHAVREMELDKTFDSSDFGRWFLVSVPTRQPTYSEPRQEDYVEHFDAVFATSRPDWKPFASAPWSALPDGVTRMEHDEDSWALDLRDFERPGILRQDFVPDKLWETL
jgi:hypothetical protein